MARSTVSLLDFASDPESNGGWGSYSIISWAAWAAVRVDQQLDQPEGHVDAAGHARGGDDPLVRELDHPLRGGYGTVGRQFGVARPMGGGGETTQEPGRSQNQGSGAHRAGPSGCPVHTADPGEDLLIVLETARAHPPGEHDHIRLGEVTKGRVGDDAQRSVFSSDLPTLMADERDIDRGDVL